MSILWKGDYPLTMTTNHNEDIWQEELNLMHQGEIDNHKPLVER